MINQIQKYIDDNRLFTKNERILIGISGGRDSICLAIALKNMGYDIGLAHCNFKLRANESDTDEKFVLDFAKQNKVTIYNTSFDTESYAQSNKISIQMAARDLRYDWFEKIRTQEQFDYIAIAHNQDDIVETFFINLIRGTGVEGLTGIKPKKNKIVRPLLGTSREEINQFIDHKKISYREDSSNASTKYIRNKLRHNVLPELRSISNHFDQTMVENIDRIQQTSLVYKNEIEFKKSKIFIELSDKVKINIERLKKLSPLSTYLYEFLKPYGFSLSTILDIEQVLDSSSGKQFFSKTHQLVKDREDLILAKLIEAPKNEIFFDKETSSINNPITLSLEHIERKKFKIPTSNKVAALDFDKLTFPLLLRPWKHGDFFMPLGMNRVKKLSNFFIDSKVSIVEKEKCYVIQSKNDIVWVVGRRIDDRYKITEETTHVLLITYKE